MQALCKLDGSGKVMVQANILSLHGYLRSSHYGWMNTCMHAYGFATAGHMTNYITCMHHSLCSLPNVISFRYVLYSMLYVFYLANLSFSLFQSLQDSM